MSDNKTNVIQALNLKDVDILEEGVAPAPIMTIMSQDGGPTPPPTPAPSPPDTTLAS
jgi:hypothetical protein